jgi:hypothetical protein
VPHPRRDQDGAARAHRHPRAGQLHRRSGGAPQDVVDLGVVAAVVGAGVGLDLGPVDAGRGVGDARERPAGPAAGAAHRAGRGEVDDHGAAHRAGRGEVDDHGGARSDVRWTQGLLPHATYVA